MLGATMLLVVTLGAPAAPGVGQQPGAQGEAHRIFGTFAEEFRREDGFVDISAMVFAPTGHLVVVDADAYAVKVFDSAGSESASWGRQGQGPGEFFRPPGGLAVSKDGRVAVDSNSGRIDVFDLGGDLVDSHRYRGTWPSDLAYDAEGRLLAAVTRPPQIVRGEIVRFSEAEVLWSSSLPAKNVLDPLANFVLFSPRMVLAGIGANQIAVGVTDSYRLAVLDASSGEELGSIARGVSARGPTEEFSSHIREVLEAGVDRGRHRASTVARIQLPDVFPVISTVFVGPPGRTVWVRRHMGVDDSLAPEVIEMADSNYRLYDLFSADDGYEYMGTVEVPDRLELMTGDSLRVAGVHRSALDEQTVRVFRFSLR